MNYWHAAAIGIAVCFLAPSVLSNTVKYKVDGWCLSHERGAVQLRPGRQARAPAFLVPAPFAWLNPTGPQNETGLSVEYRKSSFENRTGLERGLGLTEKDCALEETEFGLTKLIDVEDSNCILGHRNDRFVSSNFGEKYSSIRIRCSWEPAMRACTARVHLESDWQATLLLPKEHLQDWRMAVRLADEFFDEFLTECEV